MQNVGHHHNITVQQHRNTQTSINTYLCKYVHNTAPKHNLNYLTTLQNTSACSLAGLTECSLRWATVTGTAAHRAESPNQMTHRTPHLQLQHSVTPQHASSSEFLRTDTQTSLRVTTVATNFPSTRLNYKTSTGSEQRVCYT